MSGELRFLTLADVLFLHSLQIEAFGGDASVLDMGRLESALAQPRQSFGGEFVHDDLALMAAAYLFHICQNHPFADGNKRTSTHAAVTFLETNGYAMRLDPDEMERLVLDVAEGKIGKPEVAAFFRKFMND